MSGKAPSEGSVTARSEVRASELGDRGADTTTGTDRAHTGADLIRCSEGASVGVNLGASGMRASQAVDFRHDRSA